MNRATRIIVAAMGIMLGMSGMIHGFFETLQGNAPTNSLIIQAIGDKEQMWLYGTEEAFTIIPNFLLTGILAMSVSLVIMIWSVGFVHKPYGPTVFILLFILLFLTGGGIAQLLFFIPTWLASTRINSPLTWWRKVLHEKIRPVLARLWPFSLSALLICFLIALAIAIFGFVPGIRNPDSALAICWSLLLAAWLLLLFSFVNGLGYDIRQSTKR